MLLYVYPPQGGIRVKAEQILILYYRLCFILILFVERGYAENRNTRLLSTTMLYIIFAAGPAKKPFKKTQIFMLPKGEINIIMTEPFLAIKTRLFRVFMLK